MRILHILDHSVPLHSGYAFRTRAILRQQRALGWETFHLTSEKHKGASALEESAEGLHFYRTLPEHTIADALPAIKHVTLMRRLQRRLLEVCDIVKPDVLHAHSPVLNGIPTIGVGRKLHLPVVYEVRAFWEDAAVDHGTSSEGGLRYRLSRALETHVLKRADAITTICDGLRREIISRGIAAQRITTVANAVDIDEFGVAGQKDHQLAKTLGLRDKPVLGFIGSFYAYEGLTLLLRALPEIAAAIPDVRVLLVGGGQDKANLAALCAELGLGERVIFAGRVPHTEVQRYYDLIDVLVYPRYSMRLTELVTPLKPLEAMAQQRLVVASDVGGHRELIKDGVTGLLFKAGEPSSLAAKVIELFANPQLWPELRGAARRFVENERSWRRTVANYAPVYAQLVKGGSA